MLTVPKLPKQVLETRSSTQTLNPIKQKPGKIMHKQNTAYNNGVANQP